MVQFIAVFATIRSSLWTKYTFHLQTLRNSSMTNILYFLQVGIYVVMFLEILQTLIKVLMVFSILIIAFGLAFYIVLSKSKVMFSL